MKNKIYNSILKKLSKYADICPKTGKVVALKFINIAHLLLFPVVGILAITWFLIRIIPKPYRVNYPCQKIAAGIGIAFLTYLTGVMASMVLFKKLKKVLKNFSKPPVAILCLTVCVALGLGTILVFDSLITEPPLVYADWEPGDAPNTPIGIAQGINPGRVTWAHNPDATANTPSGNWYAAGNTNQQVVNTMFAESIKGLTGESDTASAWDALFRNYNQKKGKGNAGYQSGETIVIKINTVNTYNRNKFGTAIDACGETVLGLITQLVTGAGIPQNSIIVFDGGVGTIGSYVYDCVNKSYPQVQWEAAAGWGNIRTVQWVSNGITYSSFNITNAEARQVAKCLWDADYLINLALLKKHESETAVTLSAKNHFGSIRNCSSVHTSINDQTKGMATYNGLVDLMGHERIGGKTLLYIIDGLWGSANIGGSPVKWKTAPFNNDWPSSIFMSQDGVAIDSVGLDFINQEFTLWANADNYLHEEAQADNPPSGVNYDPEADGSRLQSLGVHEHWNNTQNKQYSGNLGRNTGIELYKIGQTNPTAGPTATPTTPPGSLGDVNGDNTIDIIDALITAQFYVGLNPPVFIRANADVNKDGQITIVDALMIAQRYVGLISSF